MSEESPRYPGKKLGSCRESGGILAWASPRGQPCTRCTPLLDRDLRQDDATVTRDSTGPSHQLPYMSQKLMPTDRTLSLSTVTAVINAPLEKVDIADWLFNLPDAEYRRCSHAHIAAGSTTTDDGRPMSINVETIGDALVIQHYVAEIKGPHLCRMMSISDSITAAGRTKVQVIWELSAKRIDDKTCEYSNHIHSSAIDETITFLEEHNIPFEKVRDARQQASDAHNKEETPNFAKSIEHRALRS
jgi:hypothetical protein